MQHIFSLVKPACDFSGVLADEASVSVNGGRMEAYNSALMVSLPCDLQDFSVAVVDLDFALRKHGDVSVKVTEKTVVLNGRTRVKQIGRHAPFVKPEVETRGVENKDGLMAAIDEVFPFTTGDPARPWSRGARIDSDCITATNSIVVCQAKLDTTTGLEGITLSRDALAYIRLRREDLQSWGLCEKGLLLEFSDGGWALAAKMSMEMPAAARGLVNSVEDWGSLQEISEEYRHAILRVTDWSPEIVEIHEDKVSTSRLSTDHHETVVTELGEVKPAKFAADSLSSVMLVAHSISFDHFPNAVPFVTKNGSKGLLAGRTK